MKKILCTLVFFSTLIGLVNAQSWKLIGNAGINQNTNFLGTTDSKPVRFRTNNVARMTINANGQVGIGNTTTQAGFALTLNPTSTGGALYINDPGGGNLGLGTKSGNTGEGFRMNISSTTNPNAAIRGHTDGNGFGVLAEATGSSGFGAEAYSSQSYGLWAGTGDGTTYAAFFSGDVFSSGDYLGSDEKLKQNIKDFSGAMDIINRLHPRQYQYRQDENYKLMNLPKGSHYGLVAQEVEKLLPDLVKETKFFTSKSNPSKSEELKNMPDIEFKALNYTELIPVVIKGMQEQQQIINNLQQENEAFRQQINELKNLMQSFANPSLNSNAGGAYLLQNAPNPFNQNTMIRYYVPASVRKADLMIYTMDGRHVRSFSLSNGMNNVTIDAGSLSDAQYLYTLWADGKKADTKNMVLTK